jgi:hypothetical protein
MRNLNKTRYLLRSENSVKRKTTQGQPNRGTPLSKNKSSYKTLVLTYPYAVVIPLTLTRSLSWMLPNQIFPLKRFLMDSFTLGPTPKIDFTRTVEHTSAKAWELSDLRLSLNTLSKLREFNTKLCTIYKPIYRLTGNLKLLRFELWLSSVRTEVSPVWTVFYDILSDTAQFYLYQVHVRMAWQSVRTVFVVSPFRAHKGNPEYPGMLDIVRTCCHIVQTSCRNFPNSVDC